MTVVNAGRLQKRWNSLTHLLWGSVITARSKKAVQSPVVRYICYKLGLTLFRGGRSLLEGHETSSTAFANMHWLGVTILFLMLPCRLSFHCPLPELRCHPWQSHCCWEMRMVWKISSLTGPIKRLARLYECFHIYINKGGRAISLLKWQDGCRSPNIHFDHGATRCLCIKSSKMLGRPGC